MDGPSATPWRDPNPAEAAAYLSGKSQDWCDACGETRELAKVKGCLKCLRCGHKADCHGI